MSEQTTTKKRAEITELNEYEIGVNMCDVRYGNNEIYFCYPGVTVKQSIEDKLPLIKVDLHTGYQATVYVIYPADEFSSRECFFMYNYNDGDFGKKWIKRALKIANQNMINYQLRIDTEGRNPVVISEVVK